MNIPRRLWLLATLMLATVMLVAACNGDDDADGDTADPTETTTESTATTETGTPEPTEETDAETEALPGEGVTVQPARATWNTGYFQEAVYSAGLEDLGYDVEEAQELDNPIFYQSVADGTVHYWANGWFPLHDQYEDVFSAGAEIAGLVAEGGALEGYLIDAAGAEEFGITTLADFERPEVKEAYDADGDGLADLYACPEGWGCNAVVGHHVDDLGLRDHVNEITAGYSASMADAIARYGDGEHIFFYTWTPNWTVNELVPGEDVVWIGLPEPSYPEEIEEDRLTIAGVDGAVNDPLLMGFPANDINVVANSDFLSENPAAAAMLDLIQVPLSDIFEQNALMNGGEDSQEDIDRHAREWIEENQDQWDAWLEEARAAAM